MQTKYIYSLLLEIRALVITIVILIILATVTINSVFGDNGLIRQAEQAKDYSSNSAESEYEGMNRVYAEYANVMAEDSEIPVFKSEIERAKESGEVFENNTILTDDLENDIKIPGGFHVAGDSGTKVEEGIVIEDNEGNQFVWIPVGTYQTSSGSKTNNLSRRTFTENGAVEIEEDSVIEYIDETNNGITTLVYGEGNIDSIANNTIELFKDSAINNKGFYLGRYEQGEGNVVKSNTNVYTNITIDVAISEAKSMYNGNEYVTSELVSSYAWDTALNFICQTNEEGYMLATTTDSTYGNIGTGTKTLTGEYVADNYCNIHDMIGNCLEWTTEYSENSINKDHIIRGGIYDQDDYYASIRHSASNGDNNNHDAFRIQLYIK